MRCANPSWKPKLRRCACTMLRTYGPFVPTQNHGLIEALIVANATARLLHAGTHTKVCSYDRAIVRASTVRLHATRLVTTQRTDHDRTSDDDRKCSSARGPLRSGRRTLIHEIAWRAAASCDRHRTRRA